jgi:radical SAM superfamily enzyme
MFDFLKSNNKNDDLMNKFNEINSKQVEFANRINIVNDVIDTERKCFQDVMQIIQHMLNDLPQEKGDIYGKQIQDILKVYRAVHRN